MSVRGVERQLDVLVAAAGEPGTPPAARTVLAVGEAKAGETMGTGRLTDLELARASLGPRAAQAKLLLFAPAFTPELTRVVRSRADVALVDLERLYYSD